MEKKNFIFFATSSFDSLPHRDQFFSKSLHKLGHKVIFIEEIPSVASIIKKKLIKQKRENSSDISKKDFKRYIPPIIPTFFRSSYSRSLDKFIFDRWFKALLKNLNLNKSIVIIFSPIWFFYLKDYSEIKNLIYDLHDDVQISSRNKRTLRFLRKWEKIGIQKANFITCSSKGLQNYLKETYFKEVYLIRNGIDSGLLEKLYYKSQIVKKIGVVGTFNVKPQCYDFEVLKKVAQKFPDYKLVLVGNTNASIKRNLSKYQNIELKGFMAGDSLLEEVLSWKVCLIPFITSDVTYLINPLKLYEYIAYSKPIVAFDNFDYEDAQEFIYLSKNEDDYIKKIEQALIENNSEIKIKNIDYLYEKTWEKKALQFLSLLKI